MSETELREVERRLVAAGSPPEGVIDLVRRLARTGMFFICEECGACVPPLARDRHEYEHEYHRHLEAEADRIKAENKEAWDQYEATTRELEADRAANPGGMRITALPPNAPEATIAARPRQEPLYHRLTIEPEQGHVRFFVNTAQGKTNLYSSGGHLPAAQHFYVYGLSLIPDDGADPASVGEIRNTGQVLFQIGGVGEPSATLILNDLDARLVTARERRFLASEVIPDEDFVGAVPMHRLSIRGKPVELLALQAFEVSLLMSRAPRPRDVSLTCVLHGLRLSALTG